MAVILIAFIVIFALAMIVLAFLDAVAQGFGGGAVEREHLRELVRPALLVASVGALAVGGIVNLVQSFAGFFA